METHETKKSFFIIWTSDAKLFARLCEFGFALLSQTLLPIFVKISNEICRWICKCSVSLGNNLVNGYQELAGRDELFWKCLKYSSNIFFAMPNRYRTWIYVYCTGTCTVLVKCFGYFLTCSNLLVGPCVTVVISFIFGTRLNFDSPQKPINTGQWSTTNMKS